MLAHVRDLTAHQEAEVSDRKLAGSERFEHAKPFRIGQRTPHRRVALSFGLGGHGRPLGHLIQHLLDDIIACANTQVSRDSGCADRGHYAHPVAKRAVVGEGWGAGIVVPAPLELQQIRHSPATAANPQSCAFWRGADAGSRPVTD